MSKLIIKNQEVYFPKNGGALKDKKDHRDHKASEILAGVTIPIPSFEEGYSVRRRFYPNMPYKNQHATFGCTGFAWSLYKQVLQKIDTGEETELSPFSLYNPVSIPGTGAYIRDVGLRTVGYGVNKESTLPTPPDEANMTRAFDFKPYEAEAAFYKNRKVATVNTQSFDELAKMIYLNNGIVSGWNGHCVYFDEYGILNGKRFIKTPNSYGQGNDLYYFENSGQGALYSAWTAIDINNLIPEVEANLDMLLFSDLKLGDIGEQVLRLRRALDKLGWKNLIDWNVYNEELSKVVLNYQKANLERLGWNWFWAIWNEGKKVDAPTRENINNNLKVRK